MCWRRDALPVQALLPRPRNYDRNKGLVLSAAVLLFMALLFFGQAVAQGVTEEKSSRVVELLLTTLSPRRLLTGKILGDRPTRPRAAVHPRRRRARRGEPGRRRRLALGGPRGDRTDPAVVRPRLHLLQRRVRGGGRARLPPRGPEHRDPPGHRRSDRRFLCRLHRSQHQPQRNAGARRGVRPAPLPDGRPRADGARRHDRVRARDLGHARGSCHRRDDRCWRRAPTNERSSGSGHPSSCTACSLPARSSRTA